MYVFSRRQLEKDESISSSRFSDVKMVCVYFVNDVDIMKVPSNSVTFLFCLKPEFRPLVTIAERQRSSNSEYKFNPDILSCSREDCDNSVLGVLKVTVLPDYIDATTQRQ